LTRSGSTTRLPLISCAAFLVAYAAWQLLRPDGDEQQALVGSLLMAPVVAIAAIACWAAARRCAADRDLRRAWRLLAFGVGAWLLGVVAQAVGEVWTIDAPYSWVGACGYLAFYPFAFAGLLSMPGRRVDPAESRRMLFDGIIMALGGGTVVWYLLLGPTAFTDHGSMTQDFFTVAYPTADIVLLAALATVVYRGSSRVSRQALRRLIAGGFCFVVADIVYGYISKYHGYAGGHPVDTLWILAMMAIGFAAAAQRQPGASPRDLALARHLTWPPYVAVGSVLLILFLVTRGQPFYPTGSVVLLTALVSAAVLARQALAHRQLALVHDQLREVNGELAALATTDALTGMPNHRTVTAMLDQELERSRRHDRRLSVVFLDLDRFKALNDTRGHAAGDIALQQLGGIIRPTLRAGGVIGRWGGEEFVVVLPDTDEPEARIAAERMRVAVAEHLFPIDEGVRVTASIGVATFPGDGQTRSELVHAADAAMYAAKRGGRNRTLAAGDRAPVSA
jgi:diguanylate cyclase (GGDEF)-like protein